MGAPSLLFIPFRHYRQEFCLHVIERDELGERELYKINLLEAMLMA